MPNDAIRQYHGALIQISLGYSPVQGRLHTRYAPVRRSQNSKLFLPLDLHVLGLPLAFILSQDQTLHRLFLNMISKQPNGKSIKVHDGLFSFCRGLPQLSKTGKNRLTLSIQYVQERLFFFNVNAFSLKAGANI